MHKGHTHSLSLSNYSNTDLQPLLSFPLLLDHVAIASFFSFFETFKKDQYLMQIIFLSSDLIRIIEKLFYTQRGVSDYFLDAFVALCVEEDLQHSCLHDMLR